MPENHFDTAARYFDDLAGRFPVMCASDEFHFLPRARAADRYYDRLDDLSSDAVQDCISQLKTYLADFQRRIAGEENLEKRIDFELLSANAKGVLIELEDNRSWRHNPLLYLKIAFIGLDHALNKPLTVAGETAERVTARLEAIPRLLKQAGHNITEVPQSYFDASLAMLADCREYLLEHGQEISDKTSQKISPAMRHALNALDELKERLPTLTVLPDREVAPVSLAKTLNEHFQSNFGIKELFEMARDEWNTILSALESLAKAINPAITWQEQYHGFSPPGVEEMDTISLYRRESNRLRRFFSHHGFKKEHLSAPMALIETPTYLHSVRSSASFAAAFTPGETETSYFYITTRFPRNQSQSSDELLRKRLHREYKFLTAHETFPGHQLLDTARRRLKNPIRAQIESPLFYEGWATYAETLLIEFGYVTDPIERLVNDKRRLWRSARCQIDVGLHSGLLEHSDALRLLITNGFKREEAIRQIDRFRLNPGYQLCYSLGSYEIQNIINAFKPRQDQTKIHTWILEGGQLPFHLIRKRLTDLEKRESKAPL